MCSSDLDVKTKNSDDNTIMNELVQGNEKGLEMLEKIVKDESDDIESDSKAFIERVYEEDKKNVDTLKRIKLQ